MEDFRKLSKIAALDQEMPGPVCGNPDCEELCAEAFDAALSLRLDPREVLRKTIERELHCIPAENRSGHICRFGFVPASNSLVLSGEKKNKKTDEAEIIHIFRTGVNECKKCQALEGTRITSEVWADEEKMKSKGFWKQKNGKYLPHPNCKCRWEEELIKPKSEKTEASKQKNVKNDSDEVKQQNNRESADTVFRAGQKNGEKNNKSEILGKSDINKTWESGSYFKRGKGHSVIGVREDTATLFDHLSAKIIFDGIDDLIKRLEKGNYLPHSIDNLVIIGHGGGDDDYKMGRGDLDQLNSVTDEQVRRLKNFLHTDSVVDIRMCRAASGVEGKKTAQILANKLGCTVIAYEGYVSEKGGPADYIFPWNAPELSPRDWIHPPYKRREFRPRRY